MILSRHIGQCIQVRQTHLHHKASMGPVSFHRSREGAWTIAGSTARISLTCIRKFSDPYLSIQPTRFHIGSPTMSSLLKSQVWLWLRCTSLPRNFHWPFSLRALTLWSPNIPAMQALPYTIRMELEVPILIGPRI